MTRFSCFSSWLKYVRPFIYSLLLWNKNAVTSLKTTINFYITQSFPLWKLRGRLYSQSCIRALTAVCTDSQTSLWNSRCCFPSFNCQRTNRWCNSSITQQSRNSQPKMRCAKSWKSISRMLEAELAFTVSPSCSTMCVPFKVVWHIGGEYLQRKCRIKDRLTYVWGTFPMLVKASKHEKIWAGPQQITV